MKVALYARVSTEEQAKEGFSLNAQMEKMRAFVFSQGWKIHKEYVEEGKSAKNLERPKLQSLLKDMPHYDVVLVYKLDRLSRIVSDINVLLNTFEKNNVAFKSVTEPYDTTTAQGKLLINIFASLAQFERDQLSERTHMGMTRKHEEGGRNGGIAPFGYDLIDGNLIVNPEEAKWVKFIFDQFAVKGRNTIAIELNRNGVRSKKGSLWNGTMVTYIVSNPVYYGMIRWNYRKKNGQRTYEEIIIPGNHEAIVTRDQYEQTASIRKDRKITMQKGNAIYPFSGTLKCKRCGKKINGAKRKKANGEYRFYKCSGRFSLGICDLPVFGEEIIEQEFINNLDLENIEFEVDQGNKVDIKETEKELKKVRGKIDRLEELYIDGDISKKKYRERLEFEQKKETELLQSLESQNESLSPEDVKETIQMLKDNWPEVSIEHKKKWIQSLFDFIEIECFSNHKGGNDTAVIEITDYALN